MPFTQRRCNFHNLINVYGHCCGGKQLPYNPKMRTKQETVYVEAWCDMQIH